LNTLLEANKKLLELVTQLVAKVKEQKATIQELRTINQQSVLTDEQKAEIEKLLLETKEVLEQTDLN
jgi:hypothetical protein